MEKQTTARFFRKPTHVTDLQDDTAVIKPAPFQIVQKLNTAVFRPTAGQRAVYHRPHRSHRT